MPDETKIAADAEQIRKDAEAKEAEHKQFAADAAAKQPIVALNAKAPVTAADKLRAFEDKTFGKDCPRINGEVERGVGSPYSRMTVHQKAHYASLEHLVKAEKDAADASAALAEAEAKHETAKKKSDEAAKAVAAADAEEKKTPEKAA